MLNVQDVATKVSGVFRLNSPSFIKKAARLNHDTKAYNYVISIDDNLDKNFKWAIDQMENILNSNRTFSDYQVVIKFHLFEKMFSLSKTPEYAAIIINTTHQTIDQYMFTEQNMSYFKYKYSNNKDFKNNILKNIGWEEDRYANRNI